MRIVFTDKLIVKTDTLAAPLGAVTANSVVPINLRQRGVTLLVYIETIFQFSGSRQLYGVFLDGDQWYTTRVLIPETDTDGSQIAVKFTPWRTISTKARSSSASAQAPLPDGIT